MDTKIEFNRNPVNPRHRIDYQMIQIRQFIYEDGIDPTILKKFSNKLEKLTKKHLRRKKPKKWVICLRNIIDQIRTRSLSILNGSSPS